MNFDIENLHGPAEAHLEKARGAGGAGGAGGGALPIFCNHIEELQTVIYSRTDH